MVKSRISSPVPLTFWIYTNCNLLEVGVFVYSLELNFSGCALYNIYHWKQLGHPFHLGKGRGFSLQLSITTKVGISAKGLKRNCDRGGRKIDPFLKSSLNTTCKLKMYYRNWEDAPCHVCFTLLTTDTGCTIKSMQQCARSVEPQSMTDVSRAWPTATRAGSFRWWIP